MGRDDRLGSGAGLVLVNAAVWAAVILGASWVLRGTGQSGTVLPILGIGALTSLILFDRAAGSAGGDRRR